MGITALSRDWGNDPSIVRMVTTDNLAVVLAPGYITSQKSNIEAIQNGDFQWLDDDYILIAYGDGEGFFQYSMLTDQLSTTNALTIQVNVSSAEIMGMDVAPVLIVPAPPAGFSIIINRIWCVYHFDTAQYTAGGALGLEWGNTAALAGPAASSTLAGATFDGYTADNAFDLTPDGTDTLAHIDGMGVYLSNDTAPFATGAGYLVVNVGFQIVQS